MEGGGRNDSIENETSHIGDETSSVVRNISQGGETFLNWGKSSRRRGRNVLKMGAKRLGGRNVYGAKCPGAVHICVTFYIFVSCTSEWPRRYPCNPDQEDALDQKCITGWTQYPPGDINPPPTQGR